MELRAVRRSKAGLRGAVMLVVVVIAAGDGPRIDAAETAPVSVANTAELDRAITATLNGSDFQWRLPPQVNADGPSKDNGIARLIQDGARMAKDGGHSIGRAISRFVDWLGDVFASKRNDPSKAGEGMSTTALGMLLMFLIGVAVLLIVVVLVILWRRKSPAASLAQARAVSAAAPDLRDENTQATQLPTDGWLALAREQMARGEWRLALRALHLATLAQLAAGGLVALAKFKTNLDYEREVRRRALTRQDVANQFARRRRVFEAAWYGRAQTGEVEVRDWLAELEQPAKP